MAQTFNTNLKKVASAFVRALNAKVTATSIEKSIEENPYYPSLLSLSDTFSRFGITNNAYEILPENFSELEPPFVTFINMPDKGSDFVLVTQVTGNTVSYVYNNTKAETIEKQEFLKGFKNIIFLAEEGAGAEDDYTRKLAKEKAVKNKKALWAITVVLIFLLAITINITTAPLFAFSSIVLIKLAGLSTAVLLLIHDIDGNNAFVKNICSAGVKANCDAVLGSKASKIWGMGWGEIGFFYFAATTIFLLIPGVAFLNKTAFIAGANALAAPYIIFSIYYQWRIAKQWCVLCLTVQAALAAELVWAIFNYWQQPVWPAVTPAAVMAIAACILLPVVAWYGLKPVFIKAKDYSLYYNAYKRLQYNPDTFNSQLVQQAKAADNWQQLGINIGNPNAENTIIKVCNPYCGPCAKAHPQLEEIIKHNNNINLKVIFTARNTEHDRSAPVVKHLLAVAAQDNAAKTQQALDDWYLADKKDYATFAAQYPMNGELKLQDAKVEAMSTWCNEAEITHTPTIFVNGYRLPENYNVEELKFIL